MRTCTRGQIPSRGRGLAALLATALLASACTSLGGARPASVHSRDAHGFTITDEVAASPEVRADFETAVGLLEQERYDEGIDLLLKVTQAAPDATAAYIDLGIAYGRKNDLEHAKESLERALELSPDHPVARNELGIVYRRTGHFEDARRSYERVLKAYPDFHFARRNLAILCDVYLADRACALENYELYTRAVPQDEAAAMWMADLRNRTGK